MTDADWSPQVMRSRVCRSASTALMQSEIRYDLRPVFKAVTSCL
jgi:hypothetical protein